MFVEGLRVGGRGGEGRSMSNDWDLSATRGGAVGGLGGVWRGAVGSGY